MSHCIIILESKSNLINISGITNDDNDTEMNSSRNRSNNEFPEACFIK